MAKQPDCMFQETCSYRQKMEIDGVNYKITIDVNHAQDNFLKIQSVTNLDTNQLVQNEALTTLTGNTKFQEGYYRTIAYAHLDQKHGGWPQKQDLYIAAAERSGTGSFYESALEYDQSGSNKVKLKEDLLGSKMIPLTTALRPSGGDILLSDGNSTKNVAESNNTILDEEKAKKKDIEDLDVDVNNEMSSKNWGLTVIAYPVDAIYTGDSSQDYMKIEQFSYKAPQAGQMNVDPGEDNRNSLDNTVTRGVSRGNNIKEFIGVVKLPIPNQLSQSNGVEWGGAKANAMEMGAFFGVNNSIRDGLDKESFSAVLAGVAGDAKEAFNKLRQDNEQPGQIGSRTILSAALSKFALSKVNINVDTNQFIARSSGMAINPNLELLFSGPKLRSFTFLYDFAPNSESDAWAARRIQRFFKQGMLPFRGSNALFLGSPNIFRLGYYNGQRRIRSLPIHKMCALTQVNVDYSPEGVWQSYYDSNAVSMPPRAQMQLSFTELTPIFGDDYNMTDESLNNTQSKSSNASDASLNDLVMDGAELAPLKGINAMNKQDVGF